ncbi:MAG: flagellar biosynthesis protein FlhA [Pontibacterium sp.]
MDRTVILNNIRGVSQGNLGVPFLLLIIMAMVTLPMPPFLLDVLFTFNIALSLVVLLVSVYALRPLDFAVFPSILLVATLMRLALNVASTRVVLLYGHEGGDAAGKVIEAFGEVVIGGNYVVGLVVFLILVIINFVVVTKGAGRISEVSARFTLDAMPGKQMAIDADLNAGLIDQEQARSRREEVTQEADFYGSMDGASKFVRGDAVAGILILVINIIGGFAIGMFQHGLDAETAMRFYSMLTIGDGLVAQIPSLLLSTAAAIMVTRQNTSADMGGQIINQLFASPKALGVSAAVIAIMGIVPGMPHFAFLSLAAVAGGAAWFIYKRQTEANATKVQQEQQAQAEAAEDPAIREDQKDLDWNDVMPVDMVGLEVGYRLIPLVDKVQGGQLLARIKGVRKKLSQDLGFLVPAVHIRDNLDLLPSAYRITLMGVIAGESEIYHDKELAIDPGQVFGDVNGVKVKDPAFGLDAVWIDPSLREHAQSLGYTVVDASTVVATHLNQLLQTNAHELLGHEEVQQLLDMLAKSSPKLVEELVPNKVSISVLLKVLQNLLMEQVPLKDFRTIAEALASVAAQGADPVSLTAAVRIALSRLIVQTINGSDEELPVITLDGALEKLLLSSVQQGGDSGLVLEPGMAERLQSSLAETALRQEMNGRPSILMVSAPVRPLMAKFVRYGDNLIHVLSHQEVPENKRVTIVATVGGQ